MNESLRSNLRFDQFWQFPPRHRLVRASLLDIELSNMLTQLASNVLASTKHLSTIISNLGNKKERTGGHYCSIFKIASSVLSPKDIGTELRGLTHI